MGKEDFLYSNCLKEKTRMLAEKKVIEVYIYISDLNPVYKIYRRLYLLLLNKIEK